MNRLLRVCVEGTLGGEREIESWVEKIEHVDKIFMKLDERGKYPCHNQ
jgi:hypothetical protein